MRLSGAFSEASFGQYIPGTVVTEAIHGGESGRLQQLGEDASRRTNLILVNLTSNPLTVDAELFKRSKRLPKSSFLEISRLLKMGS